MSTNNLIETSNAQINGNYLYVGNNVPSGDVNLAYYNAAIADPNDCVQIISSYDDIPGNENSALSGTRQIKVNSIELLPSNKWAVSITPGSFYFTEVLRITDSPDDRVQRVVNADVINLNPDTFPTEWGDFSQDISFSHDDDYPNEVILRWEYSIAKNQALLLEESVDIDINYSDPISFLGENNNATQCLVAELPKRITRNLYQVTNTPIITTENVRTFPRALIYENGQIVNTPSFSADSNVSNRFTVIDSFNGIIHSETDFSGRDIVIQYLAVIQDYKFNASLTNQICPINLNPMSNQIATSSLSLLPEYTNTKLQTNGVELYIHPIRCVMLSKNGNVLANFENDRLDYISWYYESEVSPDVIDNYNKKLASIYARPTITPGSITLYDTRVRGGGIVEDEILDEYPDHVKYFDIEGVHLDGDVSMENGVVIVKIATAIYNEHGEAKIREAIEKSIAGGIAYILKVV